MREEKIERPDTAITFLAYTNYDTSSMRTV